MKRVFELCNRKYRSVVELAQTMGISQDLIYRVKKGERGINGRFIIGAAKAFPGFFEISPVPLPFRVVP